MTAVASGDLPEEWGIGDQIHLEVYTRLSRIADLSELNAIVWFANSLIIDHVADKINVTDDDIIDLDNFLDHALLIEATIKRYLGDNYIQDYLDTLEDEND